MKRILAIALVACSSVAADAPQSPSDKLEGRWWGGIWTCNGVWMLVVDSEKPVCVLEVTDKTLNMQFQSHPSKRWSYTLNQSADLNTIDLTVLEGPDKGRTQLGIYSIKPNAYKGYYLTICIAPIGHARPTDFVHKANEGIESYSFARYPNLH